MTKLGFVLAAIMLLAIMVAPSVYAHKYCVIRNDVGQMGVTDAIPAYGWYKVSAHDCFSTVDAAERDAGTGKGTTINSGYWFWHPYPNAIPKGPWQPYLAEGLP